MYCTVGFEMSYSILGYSGWARESQTLPLSVSFHFANNTAASLLFLTSSLIAPSCEVAVT